MISILNNIKEYIDMKGIPFDTISINYSYFPKYYNQAILNRLRKITGNHFELGPSNYTISFDKYGNIYLMIHDNTGKTNLCIANTTISLDSNLLISVIPEKEIMLEAKILKDLDRERKLFKNMINNKYQGLNAQDKVNLENNIINTLVNSMVPDVSYDLVKESMRKDVIESTNNIISYIDYLNQRYMEEVKLEEDNSMKGIMFIEPEKDYNGKRVLGNTNTISKERNNPLIPANDRISILNNYKYIYRDYAYTSSNKEIEYLNYLYKIDSDKYLLLMEPYNGNKFTRMAIINTEGYISREDFDVMVRKYLELSNREFDYVGNTVKISHTSIEAYSKKIDYAIMGVNDKINNPYFVERVKKIKK